MKVFSFPSVLFFFSVLFVACDSDDETADHSQITLGFTHSIGGQSLDFDEIKYANTLGNNYSVETLRYFVSDFTLHPTEGTAIFLDIEHYVDGREPSTMSLEVPTDIPNGTYSRLSFVFGLQEEKNERGRYTDPPESNMEWPIPMGPGYHYMKLEGKFDGEETVSNYQCHTGQSMGTPYFIELDLPLSAISMNGSSYQIEIDMDINEWWEGPNQLDLNDMTMIMGNEEMQGLLKENGANVFSARTVD